MAGYLIQTYFLKVNKFYFKRIYKWTNEDKNKLNGKGRLSKYKNQANK